MCSNSRDTFSSIVKQFTDGETTSFIGSVFSWFEHQLFAKLCDDVLRLEVCSPVKGSHSTSGISEIVGFHFGRNRTKSIFSSEKAISSQCALLRDDTSVCRVRQPQEGGNASAGDSTVTAQHLGEFVDRGNADSLALRYQPHCSESLFKSGDTSIRRAMRFSRGFAGGSVTAAQDFV